MKNKKITLIKKGFSIGEVILSVFILGVTMVTILSIYAKSIKELQDERDSIIAAMLSQEGIELVRNVRDNNWAARDSVTDTDPITFDISESHGSGSFDHFGTVDMNDTIIKTSTSVFSLNLDGNGFYVHDAGTATKFRRRIIINYNGGGSNSDVVNITSFVTWNGVGPTNNPALCTAASKCVFTQSTLTNWGTGT